MSLIQGCRIFFSISNLLGMSLVCLSFVLATVVTYRTARTGLIQKERKAFPDIPEQICFIRKIIWCAVLFLLLFYFVSIGYQYDTNGVVFLVKQYGRLWLIVFIVGVIWAIVLRCIGRKKGWVHIKNLLRLSLLTAVFYGLVTIFMK